MTRTTHQLRLPRQVAAPEGPVDMSMMYVMHHAFRRDLEAFALAVPRTPVDDGAAWKAMHARWRVFSTALHHHHQGEDTWLWPALIERAGEEDRRTLEAMEAEHEQIDPLLESCTAGFDALLAGAGEDSRNALAVRLAAARECLARHLEHEESDAIAILQRVLTQSDWEEIDAHFKEGIGIGRLVKLVPWALHELSDATREQLFSETGAVHRILWRVTRSAFERQDRVAFSHLT